MYPVSQPISTFNQWLFNHTSPFIKQSHMLHMNIVWACTKQASTRMGKNACVAQPTLSMSHENISINFDSHHKIITMTT